MKIGRWVNAVIIAMGMFSTLLAGEILLAEHRLAVTLPASWKQIPEQRAGILLRAESDSGRLRFIMTKPPVKVRGHVKNVEFQVGIQRSLRDQGFSKLVRSEMVKVAGSDAYLCEAAREDGKPHSTLQIVWFHEGDLYSLVFASASKRMKEVAEVQTMMESVKVWSQG